MKLTQAKSPPHTEEKFPTTQFAILALCRLAEPIAITSIFPYAWLMVSGFHVGSKNDASFYAGILIASFSFAEAISSMWWGGLSDRIGRKPVLLLGCFGTMLSLLVVGFSPNFTIALIGRILGGLLNGNIGVIQTMVGELVTKPEHEPKAYSIMPFIWAVGTIAGPCIGGLLAKPAKSYPQFFSRHSFFGKYPWALPNIVCAALMLFSIAIGYLWLQETHPNLRKDADPFLVHDVSEQTPMIQPAGATADQSVDLRQDMYGTFTEMEVPQMQEWRVNNDGTSRPPSWSEKQSAEKWFTWRVAMLTLALGIYTYHAMCYDHLLPIFFQDERADEVSIDSLNLFDIPGGLGLSTANVGIIMAVNGVIALSIQAIVFPYAAEKLGIWKVFVLVTILHPTAYFIVPYLSWLPENLLFPGIYIALTLRQVYSILAYPVLLILLKQASLSPNYLGRINGLAAAAGAGCRTIAPPIAGLLYGWGLDFGFTGLAWWGAGLVAIIGVVQLYFVPREKNDVSTVKSLITGVSDHEAIHDVVNVTVVATTEEV